MQCNKLVLQRLCNVFKKLFQVTKAPISAMQLLGITALHKRPVSTLPARKIPHYVHTRRRHAEQEEGGVLQLQAQEEADPDAEESQVLVQ